MVAAIAILVISAGAKKHSPTLGGYLLAGGGVGVLFGLILLLGSV